MQHARSSAPHLQGLLGGLSNVLETLRGEGVPPPACRAVVHAALRYVDAELLNALMLRRDCCSISAVKVLQVSCWLLLLMHVQRPVMLDLWCTSSGLHRRKILRQLRLAVLALTEELESRQPSPGQQSLPPRGCAEPGHRSRLRAAAAWPDADVRCAGGPGRHAVLGAVHGRQLVRGGR